MSIQETYNGAGPLINDRASATATSGKAEPDETPAISSPCALDPSLDFTMPSSNIASASIASDAQSTSNNIFLAAINRLAVAISPKPHDRLAGSAFGTTLDIPVHNAQTGADTVSAHADHSHVKREQMDEVDPRITAPDFQHQMNMQVNSLLYHSQPFNPSEVPLTPISEARLISNESLTPTPSENATASPSVKGQSIGRRKRGSTEYRTPRKPVVRIKPPEQIAAEALIEQQNPNATRNQLRSLKLRALHAGRIAERELGMSEEEKARRLRLREYVRQKRADEREDKLKAKREAETAGFGAGDRSVNFSMDIDTRFASQVPLSHDPQLFNMSHSTLHSSNGKNLTAFPSSRQLANYQPIWLLGNDNRQFHTAYPVWQDPALHTPRREEIPARSVPASAPATTNAQSAKRKRASADNPGGSEPRRKSSSRVKTAEQAALEAQIERENPGASQNQLKSLKLRALHAGRILERERDMSEKEKARRLKLREYMRRRREDERGEPKLEPAELKPLLVSTELNAADRSAAFSILELNNTFQQQFQPPPPAPVTHTNHNLHLHPLFQMPAPISSAPPPSLNTHFDPAINPNYALPEGWPTLETTQPMDSAESYPATNELAERALHAALEQAIFLKDHQPQDSERMSFPEGSNAAPAVEPDRVAALEQERIRIAEEEIFGVERARMADAELAIIAAAAAEVEKAQIASVGLNGSNNLSTKSENL